MCLKDGLNAPRYQHVVDLPEGVSYGDEDLDEELSDGPEEEPGEEPGEDGQAATTNINGGASTDFNIPPAPAVKIPRPPNSWILYRKDKSKELLEANPGMSTGAICKFRRYTMSSKIEDDFAHQPWFSNGGISPVEGGEPVGQNLLPKACQ